MHIFKYNKLINNLMLITIKIILVCLYKINLIRLCYENLNFIKHLMQAIQGGEIGLVLQAQNFVPYSSKEEDVDAAQRLMDFTYGWFVQITFLMIITYFSCVNFFKKN